MKNEFIYYLVENGGFISSGKQRDKMFETAKSTTNLNAVLFAIGAITYDKRKFIIYDTTEQEFHKDFHLPFGAVGIICSEKAETKCISETQIREIVEQILFKLKYHNCF